MNLGIAFDVQDYSYLPEELGKIVSTSNIDLDLKAAILRQLAKPCSVKIYSNSDLYKNDFQQKLGNLPDDHETLGVYISAKNSSAFASKNISLEYKGPVMSLPQIWLNGPAIIDEAKQLRVKSEAMLNMVFLHECGHHVYRAEAIRQIAFETEARDFESLKITEGAADYFVWQFRDDEIELVIVSRLNILKQSDCSWDEPEPYAYWRIYRLWDAYCGSILVSTAFSFWANGDASKFIEDHFEYCLGVELDSDKLFEFMKVRWPLICMSKFDIKLSAFKDMKERIQKQWPGFSDEQWCTAQALRFISECVLPD